MHPSIVTFLLADSLLALWSPIMIALAPVVGLAAGAIWLITAAIGRYSSLASLMAAGWAPVVMAFTDHGHLFLLGVVLGLLVYARHWANIQRLRSGTETKIGAK